MHMFVKIPEDGYWFAKESIRQIEENYGAKYMGYWTIKNKFGNWGESPVDVFYQPNPDTSKGHTHYFGMFSRHESVFITEASSAFSEPIAGIPTDDGEVIVSRYRHDYVEKDGRMIDGGRDYTRSSMHPIVQITVDGDKFIVSEREDIEESI